MNVSVQHSDLTSDHPSHPIVSKTYSLSSTLVNSVALFLSWLQFKTLSVTTMAGPPALDEEELSSEDDSDEEEENDVSEEGEVNVGLGGLVMREKDCEEENQMVTRRNNGGKRSSGEAETEEEEDFSSPPAKVVTPSKRRVIVSGFLETSLLCKRSDQIMCIISLHHAQCS